MSKYLFFIIIGIILFVLYNHIDSFSIGIPVDENKVTYVLLRNSDNSYSIIEAGGAGDGTQTLLWTGDLDVTQFDQVNQRIQQYPTRDPRLHFLYLNEEADAEAVPPCPAIPEGVANGLCQPEPEPEHSCATGPRSSLDGPGLRCGQPQVVGTELTGGGGGGRAQCNRFLQTRALRCYADNPDKMKSLFEEYELLSALLSLQKGQITNIPGFESLTPTMVANMLSGKLAPAFFLIFDFIRTNCQQLFRFSDVIEILNGITFHHNHFQHELREITDLEEIKRRSRTIICILLLLIKCNFNNDLIKEILDGVLYSYLLYDRQTYESIHGILVYNILKSLFMSIQMLNNYDINGLIYAWSSIRGSRFNAYPFQESGSNLWDIDIIFTYDDYISLFQYLSDNWPRSMMNGSQRPNIISALMDPIFRNFFGLPDP